MSRNFDPAVVPVLSSPHVIPIILAMLTFRTATKYIWAGIGDLVVDAQTYVGIGSLGKIGVIQEGIDVQADGATVTLSGIDPALMAECMDDIQLGAPAKLWLGFFATTQGPLIGAPYLLFSGSVDQPTMTPGLDTISISLALETRMSDLARPSARRYTSADQRLYYPTDISMSWVEQDNDIALIWGQ